MARMSTSLLKRKIAELTEEIDGGENTSVTVKDMERRKAKFERIFARHVTILSSTKREQRE